MSILQERGKPGKVVIYGYNNIDLSKSSRRGDPFTAMMNPESYTLDYKVTFNESQGQGTTSTQQRFFAKLPEVLEFEFLFDSTGIIDHKPRPNGIQQEIEAFKKLLLENDPDSHEPLHFLLVWGDFKFKGRCTI